MGELIKMIRPEMLALLPVLIGIGASLKKWGRFKPNYIPYILIAVGIVAAVIYSIIILKEELTAAKIAVAAVEGLIMAVSAVGGHQCYKQIKEVASKDAAKDESEPAQEVPEPPADDKEQ